MEDNRKTDEQKKKEARKRMFMLLGFAAAMGAMVPDGGYLQDGSYMEEDFEDDELADMV